MLPIETKKDELEAFLYTIAESIVETWRMAGNEDGIEKITMTPTTMEIRFGTSWTGPVRDV